MSDDRKENSSAGGEADDDFLSHLKSHVDEQESTPPAREYSGKTYTPFRREKKSGVNLVLIYGAVAVILILLVQSGNLLLQRSTPEKKANPPSTITFTVKFADDLTEKAIRGRFQQLGLEITGGPDSEGMYRIRVMQPQGRRKEHWAAQLAGLGLFAEISMGR